MRIQQRLRATAQGGSGPQRAERLRRLVAAAVAAEQRQRVQELLCGRIEHAAGPGDGITQAALRRLHIERRVGEQGQGVLERMQDLRQRQHRRLAGRQLDGQRIAIEAAANGGGLGARSIALHRRAGVGGHAAEHLHGCGFAALHQRRQGHHSFHLQPQRHLARYQQLQLGRRLQQCSQRQRRSQQMLEAIEQQQQLTRLQMPRQLRLHRSPGRGREAQRAGDRASHLGRAGEAGARDDDGAVAKALLASLHRRMSHPALAQAGRSGERDQPHAGIEQHALQSLQLIVAPQQRQGIRHGLTTPTRRRKRRAAACRRSARCRHDALQQGLRSRRRLDIEFVAQQLLAHRILVDGPLGMVCCRIQLHQRTVRQFVAGVDIHQLLVHADRRLGVAGLALQFGQPIQRPGELEAASLALARQPLVNRAALREFATVQRQRLLQRGFGSGRLGGPAGAGQALRERPRVDIQRMHGVDPDDVGLQQGHRLGLGQPGRNKDAAHQVQAVMQPVGGGAGIGVGPQHRQRPFALESVGLQQQHLEQLPRVTQFPLRVGNHLAIDTNFEAAQQQRIDRMARPGGRHSWMSWGTCAVRPVPQSAGPAHTDLDRSDCLALVAGAGFEPATFGL